MTQTSVPLPPPSPFDAWAVFDFWLRRWRWLAGWTVVFAVVGAGIAALLWGRSFTSTAQLIHYEPSAVDDTFHPRAISTPSLVVMLQSPGLLEEIGAQLSPPVAGKLLARRLTIILDRNNDVATVTAVGSSAAATADLVTRFCAAAIAYTRALQRVEATEADLSVTRQLAQVESEIAVARAAIPAASVATVAALSTTPDLPVAVASDLPQRVQAARDQLDDLLTRFTDVHPLVREQRARLASLDEAQRRSPSSVGASAGARSAASPVLAPAFYGRITPEEVAMGERFRALETNRALLIGRQRAIQPFRDDPPGYFRVLLSPTANPTLEQRHRLELVLCSFLGAFFGLFGSAAQILLAEFLDNRIKTRADVRRVTGLPLLATLGDLKTMLPADRDQWAFRAWTTLQSRLSVSSNHGIVCGLTSAHSGDGRSTWIDLLAGAAGNCGFRVLTITAQPSPEIAAELARRDQRTTPATATTAKPFATPDSVALTASVLSAPAEIVTQLCSANASPRVDIPLPGWVWNLERRKQWHTALEAWRAVDHVVIFVELPPASVAETVLLAENVPNILWLVDSNRSDAAETHAELETLRDARCHLVGAVLNRERTAPLRGRFSRWFGASAALLVVGLAVLTPAPARSAGPAPAAFSATDPAARAAWQQRLTLGPGDVVSFHLFGSPELTRDDVPVGPDGRISYLEAESLVAAGLTVDELRDRLNEELGKFRRAPQAYVTPRAYRSQRYYVLGTVVQKGIFPLDRSVTIIEAVALARGFETGVSRGNLIETTDFSRSFLSRGGRRLPVDFEKLFLHGDLAQNVALEPGDYLGFPAAAAGSIYVLGEVRAPGSVVFDADTSVLSAIATRGGFGLRAWKKHVLVVRQSTARPEAFKVDAHGALAGTAPNFALLPGDLVYVSNRPWIRVEELLDRAASAFIEAAVISWTGLNIGPGGNSTPGGHRAMKFPPRSLASATLVGLAALFGGCEHLPLPTARSGAPTPPVAAFAHTQPAPVEPLDPALLRPGETPFRLGPGDQLDLEVMGDPSTRASVTVGPDGKIYYYMLPGLDVWGLTLPETRARLAAELTKFIREKPVVALTLRVVASQRVWILGRVNTPGIYPLAGPTTLLDAVAQAGGLASSSSQFAALAAGFGAVAPSGSSAEAADLSRSFVIRRGRVLPVDFQQLLRDGAPSQNIYLQPDDFIFLPSTRTAQVHILGAVIQPHSERMTGALTVVQAIALSGGADREAILSNVAILRGSLAAPQIAIVAVDQILLGQAPDVRLEPGDIVFVPFAPQRVLTRYVNLILDTFARTVGVNAGARAISGNAPPVGIGVNISP